MMTSTAIPYTIMPTETPEDNTHTEDVTKNPTIHKNTPPPSQPTNQGDLCDDAELPNHVQLLEQNDQQQQKEAEYRLQPQYSGKQQQDFYPHEKPKSEHDQNLFEEKQKDLSLLHTDVDHQRENKGEGHPHQPQNREPSQGQKKEGQGCQQGRQDEEKERRSAYDEQSPSVNVSLNKNIRKAEENTTTERESEVAWSSGDLGLPKSWNRESGIVTDSSGDLSSDRHRKAVTSQPSPEQNKRHPRLDKQNHQFKEEEEEERGGRGRIQVCCDCLQACLCLTCCCSIRFLNKFLF